MQRIHNNSEIRFYTTSKISTSGIKKVGSTYAPENTEVLEGNIVICYFKFTAPIGLPLFVVRVLRSLCILSASN